MEIWGSYQQRDSVVFCDTVKAKAANTSTMMMVDPHSSLLSLGRSRDESCVASAYALPHTALCNGLQGGLRPSVHRFLLVFHLHQFTRSMYVG